MEETKRFKESKREDYSRQLTDWLYRYPSDSVHFWLLPVGNLYLNPF